MKRLLLVDDNPAVLEALCLLLEDRYELLLAHDGAQALRTLEKGGVDLVLLDVLMPILGGDEVLQEMRRRGDRTPVVLLSAHADLDAQAEALGADDHLGKPFDPLLLEEKVARLLGEDLPTLS